MQFNNRIEAIQQAKIREVKEIKIKKEKDALAIRRSMIERQKEVERKRQEVEEQKR